MAVAGTDSTRATKIAARLFERFAELWSEKFTKRFSGKEEVARWHETWGVGLADLSRDQLVRGFSWMVKHCEWPPTAVADFRKHCMFDPVEKGFPVAMVAYQVALAARSNTFTELSAARAGWMHGVIFHAAHDERLSWYQLKHSDARAVQVMWEPVYVDYVQRFVAGEDLTISEFKALTRDAKRETTEEEKERQVQAYAKHRAMLVDMGYRFSRGQG